MADTDDEHDDMMTKRVQLNDDIYSLFFCVQYNGIYDKLQAKDKFMWWCTVIATYLMQFACLGILSHAYVTQFSVSIKPGIRGHEESTDSPIHFGFAATALFVVFCYIMSSIKPFIDLLAMCLTHYDNHNELSPSTFYYGLLVSIFNMALIGSTWMLSLLIIEFGLYTKIENPADVLLVSIGNVIILEVDDWIYKWFNNEIILFKEHECNLIIKVHCHQFYYSSNHLRKFIAAMGVIVGIWWSLQAADFYQNMSLYSNLAGVALATSYCFCFVFLFYFLFICLLPTGIQEVVNTVCWIIQCIAGILLSCFWYQIFAHFWYKLVFGGKKEEYYSISTGYHTFAVSMGCINFVLLLNVIILEGRKSKLNIRNVLVSDILFFTIQFISIVCILSFRIGGQSEWSEPCVALLPITMCIFSKYYALKVFNREYTSKVYYTVFKVQM